MGKILLAHECAVLDAVEEVLSDDAARIFRAQVREANLIQRDPSGREVRFYRTRLRFFQRRFSEHFKNTSPEICLAEVDLGEPTKPDFLVTAAVWLVSGRVFSIEFSLKTHRETTLVVLAARLLIDPQVDDNSEPKTGNFERVKDWLANLAIFDRVLSATPAVPERIRSDRLNGLKTTLPDDWVAMIGEFDGFSTGEFTVHGLSNIPRIDFSDETYLILAVLKEGQWIIAVPFGSQSGEMALIDHDGAHLQSLGTAFEAALVKSYRSSIDPKATFP